MVDPHSPGGPTMERPPIGWLLAAAGERAAGNFRALLPDGLHPRQFAVLQLVAKAPGPLTQADAARELGIPASRVVGIVDHLERDALLARLPDPHDRRARRLALTPEGEALLGRLAPVVVEANRRAVAPLTPGEQDELRRLLTKIIETPHAW